MTDSKVTKMSSMIKFLLSCILLSQCFESFFYQQTRALLVLAKTIIAIAFHYEVFILCDLNYHFSFSILRGENVPSHYILLFHTFVVASDGLSNHLCGTVNFIVWLLDFWIPSKWNNHKLLPSCIIINPLKEIIYILNIHSYN